MKFLCIVLMMPMLFAQAPGTPGSVEGIVCEIEHCKPIDGVRIVLSPTRKIVMTDALGRFRFAGVPPGKYSLAVDADNFSSTGTSTLIAVADGQNVQGVKIE